MKQQYFKRKAGVPFVFKGISFDDAILVLSGIKELTGVRGTQLTIIARVFDSVETMEANLNDYLKEYQFVANSNGISIFENAVNGSILNSFQSDQGNLESFNVEIGGVKTTPYVYDLEYNIGKVFTTQGLSLLLSFPSLNENKTLGDEWEI